MLPSTSGNAMAGQTAAATDGNTAGNNEMFQGNEGSGRKKESGGNDGIGGKERIKERSKKMLPSTSGNAMAGQTAAATDGNTADNN